MLPLGNGILMKMWQHFFEWTLVDGWSNEVALITCNDNKQTLLLIVSWAHAPSLSIFGKSRSC